MRSVILWALTVTSFALDRSVSHVMSRGLDDGIMGPIKCYVGVVSQFSNTRVGTEVLCDGYCGSFTTMAGGYPINTYNCFTKSFCDLANITSTCATIIVDRDLWGCCCNTDNCNVLGTGINTNIPTAPREAPIACYSGISVNNVTAVGSGWSACQGSCTVISFTSTRNGNPLIGTIYTCYPTSVCTSLNVLNSCKSISPATEVCSCTTDACIDPTGVPPGRPVEPQLNCFVGLYSEDTSTLVGQQVFLDDCRQRKKYHNNIFECVTRETCQALQLYNSCQTLVGDPDITACCCDDFHGCNAEQYLLTQYPPQRVEVGFVIACFSGIRVDRVWVTPGKWTACWGKCASITMTTAFSGALHVAEFFTCHLVNFCTLLGIGNNCTSITTGISGCCCDTNACIDPTKIPDKTPANKLQCYVGMYVHEANINVGAEVYCGGKCAVMNGLVNGVSVVTFHCVPNNICTSLQLNDACQQDPNNGEVRICCCDNKYSCNVDAMNMASSIPTLKPSPTVESPITCWNGIYVNGAPITEVGFQNCYGQCASVTMNTTMDGVPQTTSIYTCDPSSVCRYLDTINKCAVLGPGFGGCCCDSDACIYPPENRNPPRGISLRLHMASNDSSESTVEMALSSVVDIL